MENSLGFTWLCLIIANMWMIASYFSDKPYLNLIGMAWILLGAISLLTSSNSELIKI